MKNVQNAKTAQECMEIAGLDYKLELQPIYIAGTAKVDDIPVQGKQIAGKSAVVRTDNGNPIGVVGKRYEIVQNAEVFSFFDGIVEQGLGTYREAYCADGGAKVSVICDMGYFKIGQDECKKQLILRTSHDGSCAVTGIMRVLRLVCTNGLMAWRKKNSIKIRHTSNYQTKMAQARHTLGIAAQYYRWFEDSASKLYYQELGRDDAWEIITKKLMPAKNADKVSTKMKNAWSDIYSRFLSGRGNNGRTAWDLYNGVTEYVDHYRSANRSEEARHEANLVGAGARLKEDAFELLTR